MKGCETSVLTSVLVSPFQKPWEESVHLGAGGPFCQKASCNALVQGCLRSLCFAKGLVVFNLLWLIVIATLIFLPNSWPVCFYFYSIRKCLFYCSSIFTVCVRLYSGWSAPSAIGIAGLGGGFEIGVEVCGDSAASLLLIHSFPLFQGLTELGQVSL